MVCPGLPAKVHIGNDDYDVPAGAAVIGPHASRTHSGIPIRRCRYVIVMSSQTNAMLEALHSGASRTPADLRKLFASYGCELLG